MENQGQNIVFFGASLVSAYWNEAATYFRGIAKELHKLGHRVTFCEPDIFDRQKYRDLSEPHWCDVLVYPQDIEDLKFLLDKVRQKADVVIKTSNVGIFDGFLEREISSMGKDVKLTIFWDVDAPETLDRVEKNRKDPFLELIPEFDLILTNGGGHPVRQGYLHKGARECLPIYNALDITTHNRVDPDSLFEGTLGFLGHRLVDRDARVEEFFIKPATRLSDKGFILGGCGWETLSLPKNIRHLGHVYTRDHNAFNSTPKAVMNISCDSVAKSGYAPTTRIFEAAGAAACIITDYWKGIEGFFEPGKEILVAHNGKEVEEILADLTPAKARIIGEAAYDRVINEHNYQHRAQLLGATLSEFCARKEGQLVPLMGRGQGYNGIEGRIPQGLRPITN